MKNKTSLTENKGMKLYKIINQYFKGSKFQNIEWVLMYDEKNQNNVIGLISDNIDLPEYQLDIELIENENIITLNFWNENYSISSFKIDLNTGKVFNCITD